MERHYNIFAASASDVGQTKLVQHFINTGDAPPIRQRARRLPPVRQSAADHCLEEMEASGIIEPSESPWASPVVLVPKKDGGWCFCLDFRCLNEVTVKDSYLLDESLNWIAGSRWFSSLDLCSSIGRSPSVLTRDRRLPSRQGQAPGNSRPCPLVCAMLHQPLGG